MKIMIKLSPLQIRMEEEKASIEEFIVADALFHRSILRATNNELLCAMEGMIFSALLSSIRLTNKDRGGRTRNQFLFTAPFQMQF